MKALISIRKEENAQAISRLLEQYGIPHRLEPGPEGFQLFVEAPLQAAARSILAEHTTLNPESGIDRLWSWIRQHPVSSVLLLLACFGFAWADWGRQMERLQGLSYVSPEQTRLVEVAAPREQVPIPWRQPWRLITPLFLQSHPLLFAITVGLGGLFASRIERVSGRLYLAVLTLALALPAFLLQAWHTGALNCYGFGPLCFGFAGFLWARSRLDKYYCGQFSGAIGLILATWLVLELLFQPQPMAFLADQVPATGQAAAAAIGALWGFLSSFLLAKERRFRRPEL
ncbi:MAG: hypothetical protein RL095_3115 [Verrucomicrobiota bacterium]|jgi:membrane associated rhomboid family serine protease